MRNVYLLKVGIAFVLVVVCSCRQNASQSRQQNRLSNDRPLAVRLPRLTRAHERLPLVLLLHGYAGDGPSLAAQVDYNALSLKAPFIMVAPSGVKDKAGLRFWRASRSCCDHYNRGVDDLSYLNGLLRTLQKRYAIDRRRIYVLGHSNGAHMAFRLGCGGTHPINAIVSLAGAYFADIDCKAAKRYPRLLHVQALADDVVPFTPMMLERPGNRLVHYPGAKQSVLRWARSAGCAGALAPLGRFTADGVEIAIEHVGNCPARADATLWAIQASGHHYDRFAGLQFDIWQWLLEGSTLKALHAD